MASLSNLLPTSITLSSDSAIEAILTDIPLFCEGIMGIGVFTFLFLTRQVNLLSVFLYGSSFLAFVAATLDLGQVLARGRQDVAKGIGLDTVAGFIYSREVFLSLSVGFLDLFFWNLVARCPREECVSKSDGPLPGRHGHKQMHSASWNRWGLIGVILKWASLAALLSVPLLQILWRLMPGQRKFGSIYVAETTIQTSLMAIFILKFLLNISISPAHWWNAVRTYIVPISALSIGIGIGIGNLVIFSFTESSLGRFLRAVEVYLLILHSLYTTFQEFILALDYKKTATPNLNTEKFQGNILPLAYSDSGYKVRYSMNAPIEVTQRQKSWIPPRRTPTPVANIQTPFNVLNEERAATPHQETTNSFGTEESREGSVRSRRLDIPDDRPQFSSSGPNKARVGSLTEDRPFTAVSLSYYTMEDSPKIPKQNIAESPTAMTFARSKTTMDQRLETTIAYSDAKRSSIPSQQGSITSIDDLLRQQTELDNSIAALRMFSIGTDTATVAKSDAVNATTATDPTLANQSRSTFNSTKTESLSNRSEFSLSVFPDPPILSKNEVATKYPVEGVRSDNENVRTTVGVRRSGRKEVTPISIPILEGTSPKDDLVVNFDSATTQYDVTSFIGELTRPQIKSLDSDHSDAEETPTLGSATIDSAIVLRPMLLPSMITSEPTSIPALSASTYGSELADPSSPPEPTMNLRPFLLGKPITTIPHLPSTMIPLAQRRQRGGTISSNSRRPVISIPRLNQEKTEAAPGAFERPRPPPLRLNERT